MTSVENVKVAVRVRPFNQRELSREAKLVVEMNEATTSLTDPRNPKAAPRQFTYDFSYWSHDGFKVRQDGYHEKTADKYVDQVKVFTDLGLGMLANAWDGYNCSIFAYGQTGSGKSYSIMGHGKNLGLVPRTCEQLFKDIAARKQAGISYEVTFSMLEIYNEQTRDLLNKSKTPSGGLRVKESPERGFYVEGLTVVPVGTYRDIKLRMNEGDRQRTIASTKMNETSSRAHTIVTITFAQNDIRTKTTKTSSINLVDLAGSERVKQTESTGDRFEEAKNINRSLMTLGSVIKALCDKARGVNTHVPYRESVLTKLLKNTLGGNSKSVMIAAISPDAENYDQTLSTLKYADRAKSIRTMAKVNQEATNKLIQDLIDEKEKLLRDLENARTATAHGYTEDDISRLREEQEKEIQRYKDQMDDIETAWQKRLLNSQKEMEELQAKEKQHLEEERQIPHFSNLNEDPALNGKLIHLAKAEQSVVGNGKDETNPEIVLNGPRIAKRHAMVTNEGGAVKLTPLDGLVLHNGVELKETVLLHHDDRIRFGSNNLFVFTHPQEAAALQAKGKHSRDVTFEFAQNEIAKNSGLQFEDEDSLLQEEVMTIMQLVQDVNAMADDMNKPVDFSVLLVSAEARGLDSGRTEVYVKVEDLDTGNEFLWDKNKFLNRQVHMQLMYQNFEEGTSINVDKDKDPFWEPPETHVIVGVVTVPLNYLSHMLDFQDEPLTVIDYKAKQSGFLKVAILPCDYDGNDQVELCVEDPMDLVSKPISFRIKVQQAMNLPERIVKSWCQYKFHGDMEYTSSRVVSGKNPIYDHVKLYRFRKEHVNHRFIDYLREKSLSIEIWGQQGDQAVTGGPAVNRQRKTQVQDEKLAEELNEWKMRAQLLQKKLDQIQLLVEKKQGKSPTVEKIKKILKDPLSVGSGDTYVVKPSE